MRPLLLTGDGRLEFDGNELAVRMLERLMRMKRPPHLTAQQIMEGSEGEAVEMCGEMAFVALEYLREVIAAQPGAMEQQ